VSSCESDSDAPPPKAESACESVARSARLISHEQLRGHPQVWSDKNDMLTCETAVTDTLRLARATATGLTVLGIAETAPSELIACAMTVRAAPSGRWPCYHNRTSVCEAF
jgi:hypothetical protein